MRGRCSRTRRGCPGVVLLEWKIGGWDMESRQSDKTLAQPGACAGLGTLRSAFGGEYRQGCVAAALQMGTLSIQENRRRPVEERSPAIGAAAEGCSSQRCIAHIAMTTCCVRSTAACRLQCDYVDLLPHHAPGRRYGFGAMDAMNELVERANPAYRHHNFGVIRRTRP